MTEAQPLAEAALKQLRKLLGAHQLLTDPADCVAYGYDNSKRQHPPQAVALATSHDQVEQIVACCHQFKIPLTARGRGTNTTGATVPIRGGLVLSLERMNRILEVSPGDRMLICEAGAINQDVQTAAAKHDLFWPPDPTSAGFSCVGGNLGCNAGGPRAVKYGTARDSVLGLRAVTGDGRSIRTGCYTTKGVVGYDLTRLLIGSEGTLAVITEATLKLSAKPPMLATYRACYQDLTGAALAVAQIMAQPHLPCALEFMDADAVQLAQTYKDTGIPDGTRAVLLLQADGDHDTLNATSAALEAAAHTPSLRQWQAAHSEAHAADLWACRKALSPALRTLAPKKINEDVAVPVTRIPELVNGLQRLAQEHLVRIVTFGHAGNGNLHVNLLGNPDDPTEHQAMQHCLADVFRLVLKLRGTISGEHGVGLSKREFVSWEIDEPTLVLMRQLKAVFDPAGILNPGKTIPDSAE